MALFRRHLNDMNNPKESLSYRDAGVDIDAGNELVERIKPAVKSTLRPEVLTGLGGFGALFEMNPGRWRDPLLVSGTDGVGTKLVLARQYAEFGSFQLVLISKTPVDGNARLNSSRSCLRGLVDQETRRRILSQT